MALSLENIRNRMARDFKLLGLSDQLSQSDVIVDALGEYVQKMDRPRISASLAVVADTKRYSVPTTIEKIIDIRDADGDSVDYAIDSTTEEVVLSAAPSSASTYTVYGTTEDVRSNLESVVAAIPENDEHVFYAYIRAQAFEWAHHDKAPQQWQIAKQKATARRKSRNRALNISGLTVRQRDARGRYIDDPYTDQGITPEVSTQFEGDL